MTAKPPYMDQELVLLMKQGNEAAFRSVFDIWFRKLYHFSYRYTKNKERAEEVVQDTLLSLWNHRDILNEAYPLGPYLFTTCKRLTLNAIRKAASTQALEEKLWKEFQETGNTTEEELYLSELKQMTEQALNQLTPQQQMVFRLSRYEGLSHQEIANQLNISKETVKKHSADALKAIRLHFTRNGLAYLVLAYTWINESQKNIFN